MTSRRLRHLFACVLAFAGAAAAQTQDFSRVEIKAEQLSPTTWMLTGSGGNLALSAGEDAAFLVDDQFAPLTTRIEAAVAKVTGKPIRFVVNTHWHFDHTGGNENLGKAGALIVAHENVRKRMSTEQFIEFLNMKVKTEPRTALPVVTFTRDVTFHLNGDEIEIFHVPNAHTDGDSIVHFRKSDVVHMGDVVFNGMYPFIDASSGGSVEGVIAAVDRVLAVATARTKIIPGHGPLASRADLLALREMLATVYPRIRDAARAGKGLEDVQALKPTAEFDAAWGKGFISGPRFVEMIYKSLAK
ncbi:MAG: MBL fold metallo-hydrolase [Betaproteobacteria bacterium]|jgi:cyclase|nr:MBL fold metallo-hydrolase [Betaproteobacteria bacterium]MDH5286134.1 MBL fold metallo-hydrolase [Betaproteobacteria bacterium]